MEKEDFGFDDIFTSLGMDINETLEKTEGGESPSVKVNDIKENLQQSDLLEKSVVKKQALNKDNYSRFETPNYEYFTGKTGEDIIVSVLTKKDLVRFCFSHSLSRVEIKAEVIKYITEAIKSKDELVVIDCNHSFIENFLLTAIIGKDIKAATNIAKKTSVLTVLRNKLKNDEYDSAIKLIDSFNEYAELIEREDSVIDINDNTIFEELNSHIAEKSKKLYNNELKKFISND